MALLWVGKFHTLEAEKWTDVFYRNASHVWGGLGRIKGFVSRADSDLAVQGWRLSSYVGRGRGVRRGTPRTGQVSPLRPLVCLLAGLHLCCCLGFSWSWGGEQGCSLAAGFSCYRAQAGGLLGLRSCPGSGAPALWLWTQAQLLHACGVFPDQGSDPALLHWQLDSLPLSHQESLTRQALNTPAEYFFFQSTSIY